MTSISRPGQMATADPRHRSFQLTRSTGTTALANQADPADIASGWVRIVASDGIPVSLRISTVTQVIGPFEIDGRWVVNLLGPSTPIEPVAFETAEDAEAFVEDLLHDD